MSEAKLDGSQWEIDKENIQPIKQGRIASVLSTVLDESQQNNLNVQRQEFEKELRCYTGNDPLDVWYRYALWVEQNYPKGGNDAKFTKLLESCFTTLGSSDTSKIYRDDERYLDLWIRYINLCPHPLEVYQTLSAKNMFTELSKFFECWAWEMESSGNLKKTNTIYQEGLQRKAQPINNLEIAYSKFQARVAKVMFEGMNEEDENSSSAADAQRKVFASLKPRGTKAKAPIERVSSIVGMAGKMPSSAPKVNKTEHNFKIFEDENDPSVAFPQASQGSLNQGSLPSQSSQKENRRDASFWNKNKTKQKTILNVPVEDVNRISRPEFNVHADEGADDANGVRDVKPSNFCGILSSRKVQKDDWEVPLFVPEPFNPLAQPQYCKAMVYCGSEEFSFEEIRAMAQMKKEKKEKEAQMASSMQDEVKLLREQLMKQEQLINSLMQKTNEKGSFQLNGENREKVEAKSSPSIIVTHSEEETQVPKGPGVSSKHIYEDSYVVINKSVAANASQNVSQAFDESSTKALLALHPVVSKAPETSLSMVEYKSESCPSSPPSSNTSEKDYNKSNTFNTKFANNLVSELFSRSLFHNSVFGGDAQPSSDALSDGAMLPTAPEPVEGAPFMIFEDKPEVPPADACPFATPFPIYVDENEDVPSARPTSNERVPSLPLQPAGERRPLGQLAVPDKLDGEADAAVVKSEPVCVKDQIQDENGAPYSIPSTHQDVQAGEPKLPTDERVPPPYNDQRNLVDPRKTDTRVEGHLKRRYAQCKEDILTPLNDENQENIPPNDFQGMKGRKRTPAGILVPSIDIPFVPLEEQQRDDGGDIEPAMDEMDGVAPLGEDITLKVPLTSEAFAKMAGFASTPRPLSLGLVPQVVQEGDDFTMAAIIKSRKRHSVCDDSGEENDKSEERSGDLMPPPPKLVDGGPQRSCVTTPPPPAPLLPPPTSGELQEKYLVTNATSHTKNLSPIMEASREYRSSSSSSSGYCTTFGAHSNTTALTHISHATAPSASKSTTTSFNLKRLSVYGENETDGATYNEEPTRSGYLADKSRGESLTEASAKKTLKTAVGGSKLRKHSDFFDADKIALDLLMDIDADDEVPMKKGHQAQAQPTSTNIIQPIDQTPKMEALTLANQPSEMFRKEIEYPSEIDPFCTVLQKKILKALKVPIEQRGGYVTINSKLPKIKSKTLINLGQEAYRVKRPIGSGAYAQVFHATTVDPMNVTFMPPVDQDDSEEDEEEENQMILKIQKPPSFWEFYICHELRERLKQRNAPEELLNAFMRINRGYFSPQNSILVSQYHKHGTILDFVNKYKSKCQTVPESVIFHLMSEVVACVSALHYCHIIHGDLKPDNVLLADLPSADAFDTSEDEDPAMLVKLIDFGRSIDMKVLPAGTSFTAKVKTEGFTCCEMKDGRPWTYQTDYYGLAAIAHIMIWGTYMNVKKEGKEWKLFGVNYPRHIDNNFWKNFFRKMLNVSSCEEKLDLNQLHQLLAKKVDVKRGMKSKNAFKL